MYARTPQVGIDQQSPFPAIGIGDRKMTGDRRLTLRGGRARKSNRAQAAFEIRKEYRVTQRSDRFVEARSSAVIPVASGFRSTPLHRQLLHLDGALLGNLR